MKLKNYFNNEPLAFLIKCAEHNQSLETKLHTGTSQLGISTILMQRISILYIA